jgi:hypothetical protein
MIATRRRGARTQLGDCGIPYDASKRSGIGPVSGSRLPAAQLSESAVKPRTSNVCLATWSRGNRMRTSVKRIPSIKIARVSCAFAIAASWCHSAVAQSVPFPVIPTTSLIDRNRVNVSTGMPQLTGANISIGSAEGGLETKTFMKGQVGLYGEVPWLWSEETSGFILVHVLTNNKLHTFLVGSTQPGGQFIQFTNAMNPGTVSSGVYFEDGVGNALLSCVGDMVQLYGSGTCSVIEGDGEQTDFTMSSGNLTDWYDEGYSYPTGLATKTTKPDNEILTYSYQAPSGGRLTSISSSLGFMLKFATNDCSGTSTCDAADAVNTAIDYCDPVNGCTLSGNAIRGTFLNSILSINGIPVMTYSSSLPYSFMFVVNQYNNVPTMWDNKPYTNPSLNYYYGGYTFNETTPSGITTTYSLIDNSPLQQCMSNYNDCSVNLVITGAKAGSYVITYQTDNDPSKPTSVVRTNPDGSSASYSMIQGELVSKSDELGRINTYQWDGGVSFNMIHGSPALGRSYRADSIDANHGYEAYGYTNGALSSVTNVANDSSANLVTQFGITLTCGSANYKICNKPQYVIDPKGNRTDYTYDPTHGGMLTETLPPDANGVRPQKRYSYTQLYPKIMSSNGTLVNSTPVWRLTRVSECMSATSANPASCVGTSQERITTYAYNNNNLFLSSVTIAAGDGSSSETASYTYDYVGNRTSVDGPRTDVDDRTYTTYDGLRRPIYEIGADPDGAGPLPRQMTHHVYDADGNETRTEFGTGFATDGSDFVLLHFKRMTFDPTTGLLTKVEEVQP